jgi:hypothetical protein
VVSGDVEREEDLIFEFEAAIRSHLASLRDSIDG